jgi:hypothetical protein
LTERISEKQREKEITVLCASHNITATIPLHSVLPFFLVKIITKKRKKALPSK